MEFPLAETAKLTSALHHEFIRCQDAFERFFLLGIVGPRQTRDRKSAFQLYNAYSQFIHHLYEFYKGAIELDRRRISKSDDHKIDYILDREVEKAIRNRRHAIEHGNAPEWENGIECYPLGDKTGFGERFRAVRNIAFGHVSEDRIDMDLADFFENHHSDVMLLFYQAQWTWHLRPGDFPDLGAVTKFETRLLKQTASGQSQS